MDKRGLLEKVIAKLESDRKSMAEAALHTYEAATHEESEAEDQYDTRGLEASYLAGAQAKRVAEFEQVLLQFRFIELKNFSDDVPIVATALVEVDSSNGAGATKTNWYFLLPKVGGMSIQHEGKTVQVISPESPIGDALIGRTTGDVAILDTGRETRELEILKVY